MCIRDSPKDARKLLAGMLAQEEASLREMATSELNIAASEDACLLYTSDACRRIERSPSRGLGDVYKRQPQGCEKIASRDACPGRSVPSRNGHLRAQYRCK